MERDLLTRLIAGDPDRRSRLHDLSGHRVPLNVLVRNGPRAALSTTRRLLTGWREPAPWISYDARAVLTRHLDGRGRVLEFGAGMSTAWLARRASYVRTVEHDPEWSREVRAQLTHAGLDHVELHLHTERRAYALADIAPALGRFDLVLVDGRWRDACVETGLRVLALGGVLYLDNADRPVADNHTDWPRARRLLERFAHRNAADLRHFVDFAPGYLMVNQGLLLRHPVQE